MKNDAFGSAPRQTTGRVTRCVFAALVAVTAACSDVPLLPTWDTDWVFPLVNVNNDQLFGTFSVILAPGAAVPIAFPVQHIQLDQRLNAILGQRMKSATLVITISKSLAVTGSYSIAVARDAAGLLAAPDSGIALRFSVHPLVATNSDSASFSVAGLAMLQSVADAHGILWVQLRGATTVAGPGNLTIVPSDSVSIQLNLRATIASSN